MARRSVTSPPWASLTRSTCWSAASDFQARGPAHDFAVLRRGQDEPVGHVRWNLSGVHNQLNALAAIAAAEHVGVAPRQAAQALAQFQNVRRRMELRGSAGGAFVYDDFAHHPTAIRTTLEGLRRSLPPGQRILAAFEPRSNTMKLGAMKAQLPWALESADQAFCHTAGLDWDAAAALAPLGERAHMAADIQSLVAQLAATARPGDHIVCMSNGGFGGVHGLLLNALAAGAGSGT